MTDPPPNDGFPTVITVTDLLVFLPMPRSQSWTGERCCWDAACCTRALASLSKSSIAAPFQLIHILIQNVDRSPVAHPPKVELVPEDHQDWSRPIPRASKF